MPLRFAPTALAVLLAACAAPSRSYAPEPSYDAAVVTGGVQAEGGRAQSDRRLVRTATLGLRLDDDAMPAARDRAAELTESFGGGVAASGPREMTLRIPDDRLEAALDALGALGDEAGREVRAADVTDPYADLQIRLDNARALRDRLAALLSEANTVREVLEVERELARVTTEVERLEGQLRTLSERIALATVRLSFSEGARPGPVGYVFVGLYEAIKWLFVWD